MELNKVNVIVEIANVDEFRSLVEKFNQKAQELNEIALELELFRFKGEIESQAMSSNADKFGSFDSSTRYDAEND